MAARYRPQFGATVYETYFPARGDQAPEVEVAVYATGRALGMNNSDQPQSTTVTGRTSGLSGQSEVRTLILELAPMESRWITLEGTDQA